MIEPFLDQDGTSSQPDCVNVGNSEISRAVRVRVTVTDVLKDMMGAFGVEVAIQTDCTLPPHVEAANQQHA